MFNCLTGFYRQPAGDQAACPFADHRRDSGTGTKASSDGFFHPAALGSRLYYKMFGGRIWLTGGAGTNLQNIRLFREMSVIENLLVAQHMQVNRNLLAGIINTRGYRNAENRALDRAFYWLEVVGMADCANLLAGTLSYGQRWRLEIARAMCTGPEMICLDEPAAGLIPLRPRR